MKLILKVWRQDGADDEGRFEIHQLDGVSEDSSFLEMMDQLNEQLLEEGNEPVLFDHDCREGICGTCSLTINGFPHGPENSTTTCQLHMRKFNDGETITIEPFRARAFPVVRDLVVDRSAFDRITQFVQEVPRMEMLCRYPKMIRTKQWMLQHVSVVGLVLLPAKMHLRCCSLRPKRAT